MRKKNGFSLLEILVVLVVFSFLSIVVSQSLLLTLRGARKSETLSFVRENTDFALSTMERQLHNAERVYPCPNPDSNVLAFSDENGTAVSFSCLEVGEDGYVASSAGRLTSEDVAVIACSLVCVPGGTAPPTIEINLTAKARGALGSEASMVSASTNVILRTY